MQHRYINSMVGQKKAVLILSGLLFIALLSIVRYVVQLDMQSQYANQHALVSAQLAELRNRIEYEINTTLNLTLGGLVYVASNPDISQAEFARLARPVRLRAPYIRNFALARDNIISHVYPIEDNQGVLGFDYMKSPQQRAAVLKAIKEKQTVIAGPIKLVQGGQGFISRIPIFLNDQEGRYWGMSSMVVMVDEFLAKVGINDMAEKLHLALRGKDGQGERGAVFYGDASLFEQARNVTATIRLPNGTWQIVSAPRDGWNNDRSRIVGFYMAGSMLSLLISSLVYFLLIKNIKLKSEEQKAVAAGEHKSRFFTQMTHELRTPMTAIHGSIRLLESGKISSESDAGKSLIKNAERNSQRLIWLINDILDMKKLESGKMEYHKSSEQMQSILAEAIQEVEHYAELFEIDIRLSDLASGAVMVDVDRMRIQQVVINLLTNAIKFSPQGSEVEVRIENRANSAYVEVLDMGPGLDSDMLETLFDEFSQAENTYNSTRKIVASSGLGLSISKQLIEGHGGKIGCYNKDDYGAAFYFELPLSDASHN